MAKDQKNSSGLIDLGTSRTPRLMKASLSDQAIEALRRMVLRNELAAGSPVTEREVSEYLGISRTPVREAIRTLVGEGLFVSSSTGRISVANPDIQTVVNLVRILGALESLASELAAQNATDDELAIVSGHCTKMEILAETGGEFAYFDTNIAFHRTIVAASHNPQLVQMHKIIDDQLYQARYRSSTDVARRRRAVEEHKKIVEALFARDAFGARQAMTEHLTTTIGNLINLETVQRGQDADPTYKLEL